MRRALLLAIAGLAGLATAVVPALAENQNVGTSGQRFTPDKVAVKPGEKVTIVNTGRGTHNVHWEDRALPEFPPSNDQWQTERSFPSTGEFSWVCDPHEGAGMRGTVFVNEAGTVPGAGTTTGGGGTTTTSTTPPPGGTTTSTTPPPGETQTTPTPPPSGDSTPPRVTNARARATRRGLRVTLRLSEQADVTVTLRRGARRVARRTFADRSGAVTLRLRRALRRGRYRVALRFVDAAGNRSSRTLAARVR